MTREQIVKDLKDRKGEAMIAAIALFTAMLNKEYLPAIDWIAGEMEGAFAAMDSGITAEQYYSYKETM